MDDDTTKADGTTSPVLTIKQSVAECRGHPGRGTHYKAISKGDLIARKCGRLTLLLREERDKWLSSLPQLPARRKGE